MFEGGRVGGQTCVWGWVSTWGLGLSTAVLCMIIFSASDPPACVRAGQSEPIILLFSRRFGGPVGGSVAVRLPLGCICRAEDSGSVKLL